MKSTNVKLTTNDLDDLIAACWSRVVYLDTAWRTALAEGHTKAAAVLHGKLMDTQNLITHLQRHK